MKNLTLTNPKQSDSGALAPSRLCVVSDALTKEQAIMVDEIKTYHAGVRRSFEQQVQFAFLAGIKLLALSQSCDHGNSKDGVGFKTIREQFLPEISSSAAYRYMGFVEACAEKIPTVGIIRYSNLLLENGELPKKEKDIVLKAVFEAADGKTWTAFYRDLSFVRDKKPAQHHPRKQISPEEELAARKKSALDFFNGLIGDMGLAQTGTLFSDLPKEKQSEVEDARLSLGHFIKAHIKKKGYTA